MNPERHPKKRLSQNFLTNTHFAREIVSALEIDRQDSVIEIGPGKGALTQHLVKEKPKQLTLVEIDERWVLELRENYADTVHIVHGDFLGYDWFCQQRGPVKLIGNLPYHVTSPILFHILDHAECAQTAVFMTQKEVARRIVSGPDSKEYGILSVLCQVYARVEWLFTVSRGNFYPVPGVDSAVFRMQFKKVDGLDNPPLFRKVVRTSFNYRRKMLRNSLIRIFEKSVVYSLTTVSIDRRPENLTVDEFILLSNELNHLIRSADA